MIERHDIDAAEFDTLDPGFAVACKFDLKALPLQPAFDEFSESHIIIDVEEGRTKGFCHVAVRVTWMTEKKSPICRMASVKLSWSIGFVR